MGGEVGVSFFEGNGFLFVIINYFIQRVTKHRGIPTSKMDNFGKVRIFEIGTVHECQGWLHNLDTSLKKCTFLFLRDKNFSQ